MGARLPSVKDVEVLCKKTEWGVRFSVKAEFESVGLASDPTV